MSFSFIKKVGATEELSTIFRLRIYYYILEILGSILPILVGLSILFIPEYFDWFGDRVTEASVAMFTIGLLHMILFVLHEVTKRGVFFTLARYVYLVFFIYIVYITGGADSSFVFLLFFPVVTTAVYLSKNTTRNIGIVVTLSIAVMAFLINPAVLTAGLVTKYIVQISLFGVLSYFVYSMVIETLRQKYEKEESTKRLSQMVQLEQIKNDFLSVAQHQLRTPLSGVKWALDMLKNERSLPEESQGLIDDSLRRVNDSIEIVNQMLATADSEGSKLVLMPEKVDIVDLVRTIIAELNFLVIRKKVKLNFNAPDQIFINVDKREIKASLINVIDNAIKYSPNGTVDVTLEENEKEAILTVKDTGIGIVPEDMPYVFDRLHRGQNAVRLETDESGIGLYIAKRMIELHNGSITLESEVNKGTKVVVVLPK